MNPSLPVSISVGATPGMAGAGTAPAGTAPGGNFNAMILQTSQVSADKSAVITAQGTSATEGGESLPPVTSQQVAAQSDQQATARDTKQANSGDETLRQLKQFLEADVSADYSLVQSGNNPSQAQADATRAVIAAQVAQNPASAVVTDEQAQVAAAKVAAEQQITSQTQTTPVDQSPLVKAVHELVSAQQGVQPAGQEGQKASQLAAQNGAQVTVPQVDPNIQQQSQQTVQQQVAPQAQQVTQTAVQQSVVQQAAVVDTQSQQAAAVANAASAEQAQPVAQESKPVSPQVAGAASETISQNNVVSTQNSAKPEQVFTQAVTPEVQVVDSSQAAEQGRQQLQQQTQVVQQQVAQQATSTVTTAPTVTAGQEALTAQAAGLKTDQRQSATQSTVTVDNAAPSAKEENGLLKGLIADAKASAEGQKSFAPPSTNAGADSLAKLQNSASLLSGQTAEQLASKPAPTPAPAAGVEVRAETFADSLANSLTNTAAAKAEKLSAEPHQLQMQQGLRPGNPAWGQAVSERVVWLASQNGKVAEIRLDPPELGSVNVKLEVKGDQVSVVFNTPHANVKDSLEQSMPRLREMFAEQGLELSDSSVEDQSSQQREEAQQREAYASGGYDADGEVDAEPDVLANATVQSVSLVDYYA